MSRRVKIIEGDQFFREVCWQAKVGFYALFVVMLVELAAEAALLVVGSALAGCAVALLPLLLAAYALRELLDGEVLVGVDVPDEAERDGAACLVRHDDDVLQRVIGLSVIVAVHVVESQVDQVDSAAAAEVLVVRLDGREAVLGVVESEHAASEVESCAGVVLVDGLEVAFIVDAGEVDVVDVGGSAIAVALGGQLEEAPVVDGVLALAIARRVGSAVFGDAGPCDEAGRRVAGVSSDELVHGIGELVGIAAEDAVEDEVGELFVECEFVFLVGLGGLGVGGCALGCGGGEGHDGCWGWGVR